MNTGGIRVGVGIEAWGLLPNRAPCFTELPEINEEAARHSEKLPVPLIHSIAFLN